MKTIQGKELIGQIQSTSHMTPASELTLKDFEKMLKDLEFTSTERPRDKKTGKFLKGPRQPKHREYIMLVNQEGYDRFNQAMQREANKLTNDN